jgi:hypothetical protein
MTATDGPIEPLSALVGEWTYEMTHQALPGTVLNGGSTFEPLEGGKFLIQRERVDHPEFPGSSHAVIGGADADNLRMHYFDSRGVVRILELSINGRVWTFMRNKADFSPLEFHQRLTWTVSEDGRSINALGEISHDGAVWEDDIRITYRRR